MDSFLMCFSICCCLVMSADGVTLTLEMKTILPLKGSSLELSCRISEPFNKDGIAVWKGSSQVTLCYGDNYLCSFYKPGYRFITNNTGVFGSISSLTTEAEGTWRCSYVRTSVGDIDSNTWNLIVYTIPSGLSITQDPNQNVDLSVQSVVLQCKTIGCTYPMPRVVWIFQDQTTSSEKVYASNNPTGIQELCVTQEKIYTSTLNLSLYTTLNDNSDKTGTFACRIEYPDSSRNIIAHSSNTVRFAVRVNEAFLQHDNQNISTTLTVTSGEQVTLTCVTGTSRPTPDVDWYKGSLLMGNGTNLIFTPNNTDHNKVIYCQVYNIDPGCKVDSNKPKLFVRAHNATTAPSVLQRSDVECQTTSLKIFVPKNLVPGNGTVTWRDSACVVHSNGTHFVDTVGLRDCGTTLTLEADYVVFENDLILHKNGTQTQNGNNLVTYGSDYEFAIPVKCVYPRNSNISTSYIPIVQQVRIIERRNGQLDLSMRQYEAEDYSQPVPFNAYPRQVPLNNDIFIRLAMENNVTGLGLSADNCFATSTPSPVDQNWYQLISSGCPVNNAKIHPSGVNDVKFSFHAFNFHHNTSGIVYVHCQVSVCLDTDPACVVGCVTRKKRSASSREGAITSNLISTGPFILTADEGGVAMSTVIAAVSIAVAVIATVVAIIGWTRKSKKGADS